MIERPLHFLLIDNGPKNGTLIHNYIVLLFPAIYTLFLFTSTIASTKGYITIKALSMDEAFSKGSSRILDSEYHMEPFTMESCLPGNTFDHVMQDLLFFESQIGRRFLRINAVYKYTCGKAICDFTCGVPHLILIIRVRGLADDQIGIVLQSAQNSFENILPQIPKGRYSYRTWRNSRYQVIRRMLLCLYLYYKYGYTERIYRVTSRPLYVCPLGGIMGKVLDLQKRFLLTSSGDSEDDEAEMLLSKEFQ